MLLIGNKLVIPLFNSELSRADSYELCDGITVFSLTQGYKEKLRLNPELIARYESSLKYMKCGLSIEPALLTPSEQLSSA